MNVEEANQGNSQVNFQNNLDDDEDPLQDVLANTSLHVTDSRYHENPLIALLGAALASIEITLMLGLVAASFVLDYVLGEATSEKVLYVGVYYLMSYCHCVIWFIVLLFDLLFSFHHRKLKMRGYLKFYRSVKYLQRHPFCVKSLFQTVFLALTSYLSSSCKSIHDEDCHLFSLRPITWMQILTSLETAVMFVGIVIYLFRVYYQNKYRLAPDDADDHMLTSFQPHHLGSSQGVGYRADNHVDDIIEHQADKIRSLQEQNSVLNRKLYSLTYKAATTNGNPR